jgi:SWI/SNF-related matrix-associated actin-dependent regulator of chromatin subfamily A member 5
MPKSVVGNWLSEFRKWCPHIKVCNLIARKECREDIIKNEISPGNFDVCITTFEAIMICQTALMKFHW